MPCRKPRTVELEYEVRNEVDSQSPYVQLGTILPRKIKKTSVESNKQNARRAARHPSESFQYLTRSIKVAKGNDQDIPLVVSLRI